MSEWDKFVVFKHQLCDWIVLWVWTETDGDIDGYTSIILTCPCYKLQHTSCSCITLVTLILLVLNINSGGNDNIIFNKFLSYIMQLCYEEDAKEKTASKHY